MSDKAQDVAKVSGDGRVTSQASQLASRYQAALVNAKVKIPFPSLDGTVSVSNKYVIFLMTSFSRKMFLELKINHLQDLEKRWQQYVTDHEVYDHTYHDCEAWLTDIQQRLESSASTEGDKFAVQNKLDKLLVSTVLCFTTSNFQKIETK